MLEKITEAEINERSMARVSNTPGRRTAFGQSEMDAEALKLRFDRLGRFLAGKINEILGSLEDGSIAEYIYIDHNGDKISVEQFITNILNGDVDNIQIKTGYGIVYLTEIAMKTEEMYNGQFTGDSANQLYIVDGVTLKGFYEEFKAFEGETAPVQSVNGKKGDVELNAKDVGARPDTWMPSAEDVNAEPVGTAATAVETHNNNGESHQDIRRELKDLTDQMANAGAVKSVNGKTGDVELKAEEVGARPDTWMPSAADVGARPNTWTPTAEEVGARPNTWTPGYSEVGADKSGTAESKVSAHNVSDASHNDIRLLIQGLADRINAIANSTDVDLDDFKEVVAYIKANRGLIDAITTNKINYTDIINDLVTNVTNKPLSAAQGVALKALIDAITVPTKVSELQNDKGYLTSFTESDPTVPAWAKAASKPSYTKSEIGLPNVDNVKQYSAINPPPYPVTSVNGNGGDVTIDVPSLSGYAKTADHYTKTESDNKYQPKGNYLTSHQDISGKADKSSAETWTFKLKDGTTVTKKVVLA